MGLKPKSAARKPVDVHVLEQADEQTAVKAEPADPNNLLSNVDKDEATVAAELGPEPDTSLQLATEVASGSGGCALEQPVADAASEAETASLLNKAHGSMASCTDDLRKSSAVPWIPKTTPRFKLELANASLKASPSSSSWRQVGAQHNVSPPMGRQLSQRAAPYTKMRPLPAGPLTNRSNIEQSIGLREAGRVYVIDSLNVMKHTNDGEVRHSQF